MDHKLFYSCPVIPTEAQPSGGIYLKFIGWRLGPTAIEEIINSKHVLSKVEWIENSKLQGPQSLKVTKKNRR
jgi:hypothetical protein